MQDTPFKTWLAEFMKNKREVPASGTYEAFAVHSLRRFVASNGEVWEMAITYTQRVITRSGRIGEDTVSIVWGPWKTQHNVHLEDN